MSKHIHNWVLIDTYDGRPKYKPLPKGRWVSRGGLFGGTTYIPGFDHQMVLERVVDIIQQSEMPYFTYQTWACSCGKTKTNSQRHPATAEFIAKRASPQQPKPLEEK